jgi:hypothetical protein
MFPAPGGQLGTSSGRGRRAAAIHGGVAIACLALSAVMVVHGNGATPDDALITYRYAQNLLDGHGWVYDLHRHTSDAATAPLYTVLLAVVGSFVGGVKVAGPLLFVLTTAASGYLSFALLRRHSLTLGGAAAAVLMICNPWLLVTRGMETSLFITVLLLGSLLLSMKRFGLAGFVLALAPLVRGDGGAVALVAFLFVAFELRRFPWRMAVGALAAAVPWTVFALTVIGSPLPDTLGAKAAQGKSGFWGTGNLYVNGIVDMPKVFGFSDWAYASWAIGVPGLILVFTHQGLRRTLGPFVVGAALTFLGYGYVIKTPAYHWYYGAQVALVSLGGGITIGYLARAAANIGRAASPRPVWSRGTAVSLAIAGTLTMTIAGMGWNRTVQGFGPQFYVDGAAWLRQHAPMDASVAATEIGILGWQSHRDMIDYVGLLSKDSVEELKRRDTTTWITREEPDYWLVHQPSWIFEDAAALPWFPLAYRPVWSRSPVAIWQKTRPIAEAKRLEQTTIEPAASSLADQLAIPSADADSRQAVASLLAVVSTRPDLRRDYVHGDVVDLSGLLKWATRPQTVNGDTAGAAVQWNGPALQGLLARASGTYTLPAGFPGS